MSSGQLTILERLQAEYRRFTELDEALNDPAIASDPARITAIARERGSLARLAVPYGRYLDIDRKIAEAETLASEELDAELRDYAQAEIEELRGRREEIVNTLKNLVYDAQVGADRGGVIIEIRAGTGGDEAALFARDLFEMYRRYSEIKRWKFEALDIEPTELGGFREASFSVSGEGALRHLQFESGGHRVQRVPTTETQGRIHTSAATVAVLPEPEEVEIDIRTEDLHIDVMRAGGPGGQHQNKTESGVRITHLPTGVVVNCRDERSQHKNKAKAMRILRSRLYDAQRNRIDSQRAEARRSLIGSGDRSERIRTYNFPQNRMTDHRIGLTLYSLDRIIAGDLDPLTSALIDHDRREQFGGEL
ncbi:MAG: peptide chain release factor 1 [bacterium]